MHHLNIGFVFKKITFDIFDTSPNRIYIPGRDKHYSEKETPQPQEDLDWGLVILKVSPINSET